MEFTPHDARLAQLQSAEELLHSIDTGTAYPFDFVVHRITGYRPKGYTEDLLTGLALQHDLGLLIEMVSETLDINTSELPEPVLSIDDVTERFNVTSKTIQRWRRKGLPARRFRFPDGKRRVGFLLGSVERFFSGHKEQVARGMNFSQVDEAEKAAIVRHARRLAVQCRCGATQITRRVARKLNRSPLTIQHLIRKHDQDHPAQAILPLAAAQLGDDDRSQIARGYRRGMSLGQLAQQAGRTREDVYRVILDERIAKLGRRKIKFIDDELYHQDDAEAAIDAIAAEGELAARSNGDETRIPRDLPPYLADLYRTPLLTPQRERALFLKFNFHKYEFVTARRKLEPQFARARDLDELDGRLRKAIDTKNAIVRANLRLVVSVARKHMRPGLSLMELISDGNITLMRAVEGFDIHRGHRFSTYATLALMKGFARSVPQMQASRRAVPAIGDARVLGDVPDHRTATDAERLADREHVRELLSRLTDRERSVMLAHYGIELIGHVDRSDHRGESQPLDAQGPATLDEVGRRLGMSRQQVRQIEQGALAKLREVLGVSV